MKQRLLSLSVIFAFCMVNGRTSAMDGKDLLQQILQALETAPAYRMTLTTTKVGGESSDVRMEEFVQPKAVHMRVEHNGAVHSEMLSDGTKTYLRTEPDGEFKQAPDALGNSLADLVHAITPMQDLLSNAPDVSLVGHEEIAGKPISVYTCEAKDMLGLNNKAKLWVSDQDHRLLKIDAETHGDLVTKSHPEGIPVNNRWMVTYDYDPSIKITLPIK